MKTKTLLIGLIAIIIGSCASPEYLPLPENIDINEYGSYITITNKTASKIDGELIAIDSNQIVVLTNEEKKCVTVPLGEVKQFSLEYAKPKHYGWTIPVFTVATIAHGWFLIFTAPVNFIVTMSVTAAGEKAFKYTNKNMTYDKLKMFARFPQGIPTNIDLASIK